MTQNPSTSCIPFGVLSGPNNYRERVTSVAPDTFQAQNSPIPAPNSGGLLIVELRKRNASTKKHVPFSMWVPTRTHAENILAKLSVPTYLAYGSYIAVFDWNTGRELIDLRLSNLSAADEVQCKEYFDGEKHKMWFLKTELHNELKDELRSVIKDELRSVFNVELDRVNEDLRRVLKHDLRSELTNNVAEFANRLNDAEIQRQADTEDFHKRMATHEEKIAKHTSTLAQCEQRFATYEEQREIDTAACTTQHKSHEKQFTTQNERIALAEDELRRTKSIELRDLAKKVRAMERNIEDNRKAVAENHDKMNKYWTTAKREIIDGCNSGARNITATTSASDASRKENMSALRSTTAFPTTSVSPDTILGKVSHPAVIESTSLAPFENPVNTTAATSRPETEHFGDNSAKVDGCGVVRSSESPSSTAANKCVYTEPLGKTAHSTLKEATTGNNSCVESSSTALASPSLTQSRCTTGISATMPASTSNFPQKVDNPTAATRLGNLCTPAVGRSRSTVNDKASEARHDSFSRRPTEKAVDANSPKEKPATAAPRKYPTPDEPLVALPRGGRSSPMVDDSASTKPVLQVSPGTTFSCGSQTFTSKRISAPVVPLKDHGPSQMTDHVIRRGSSSVSQKPAAGTKESTVQSQTTSPNYCATTASKFGARPRSAGVDPRGEPAPMPTTAHKTATMSTTATKPPPSSAPSPISTVTTTPTSTNTPTSTITPTSTTTPTSTPTSTTTTTPWPASANTPSRAPTSTNTTAPWPTSANTPSRTLTTTPSPSPTQTVAPPSRPTRNDAPHSSTPVRGPVDAGQYPLNTVVLPDLPSNEQAHKVAEATSKYFRLNKYTMPLDERKKIYREQLRTMHPDKVSDNLKGEAATEYFQWLQEAKAFWLG